MNTDANGRIFLNWNTKFYKQTGLEFVNKPIEAPFVIFGTTAEGVTNPVPTPAGAKYPHEIQANILHNLILGLLLANQLGHQVSNTGNLHRLYFSPLPQGLSVYSVPALALIVGGSLYGAWYLYKSSYLFDVSGIVIICPLVLGIHTFLSFLSEYRQKLRIKQQFGTYVSPTW